MTRAFIAGAACLIAAGVAQAEPLRLDPDELDRVTAGLSILGVPINLGEDGNFGIGNTGENNTGLFNSGEGNFGLGNGGLRNSGLPARTLRASGSVAIAASFALALSTTAAR